MKIILSLLFVFLSLQATIYKDILGRSVEIKKAERVVFMGPGAMRMGVYLGIEPIAIEDIEKRTNMVPPYREVLQKKLDKNLPTIGAGGPGVMPNIEALIALKPDVIFSSFFTQEQIEQISKKTKIPVIALGYGSAYGGRGDDYLADIKKSLLLLGEITSRGQRAKELVDAIKDIEKDIKSIKLPKKRLYIGGISFKGVRGITSTESHYPPFALLGVKNIAKTSKKGHNELSFESFLSIDADCMFIDEQARDLVNRQYSSKQSLFDNLRAYKNECVYEVLAYNNYNTNVENLLIIPYQIAEYLGVDIDIKEKKDTIYNIFFPKKQ